MATRQPLALSLSGFQFTYRSNYFDWRLLHGIDIDNVIRLTDVQAVEDCLDTLQRGSFAAERDRLSPANCVQLFRLLQLAVEYCAHLRAAHALLLECYNTATAAAESWKAAARTYLDMGAVFVSESLAGGALNRGALDATDAAKAALEAADREYNAALDGLEAEDSRARHFRFRKQRTEISWSQLNSVDADRLVASLDVALLEGLLSNLTYGSITNEDDEQLTPHHFSQLIPLAQAALDYVLWQANATGALLEQAMSTLQSACADIPMLTSATQDLHTHITNLLLGVPPAQLQQQQQLLTGTVTPHAVGTAPGTATFLGPAGASDLAFSAVGGGGGGVSVATPMPWASASTDLGQQYGSGRLGASPGLTRASSPAPRPLSGGPGGPAQVLRIGPSRLGTPGGAGLGGSYTGGLAAMLGAAAAAAGSGGMSGSLDELVAAAALASTTGSASGAAALPVLELHSRTAELTYKVDVIEQDLRMERSKTEEMRRILADIRDRLNQRPGTSGTAPGTGAATPQGLSPVESLTFPAAAAATLEAGMGPGLLTSHSAFVNTPSAAAGLRYGSAAGVSISGPQFSDPTPGPAKVRVFVDEDAIREQERQRAVQVLARQAEWLKQQMLREHQARRLASSVATSVASASLQLQQLGSGSASLSVSKDGPPRHRRQTSRDTRRPTSSAPRQSSPGKASRPGSITALARQGYPQTDYSSDPELIAAMAAAYDARGVSRQGSGGGGAAAAAGAASSRPPKAFSRLSGPTIHGSLGDLPAAAAAAAVLGAPAGAGAGGGVSRMAMTAGAAASSGAGGRGGRTIRGLGDRGRAAVADSTDDALALPPPALFSSPSLESPVGGSRPAPAGAGAGRPSGIPQSVRMAATAAFGSISLVGPEKEAAAAAAAAAAASGGSGNVSKVSSFSDKMSHLSYQSALDIKQQPQQQLRAGRPHTSTAVSGGGGWDAAHAVASGR